MENSHIPVIQSSSSSEQNSIAGNATINNDNDYEKEENRTCMHGLIRQARHCLEEFTSPDLSKEYRIPFQILNEAKGIVFLTVLKGGMGLGGTFGSGIIIVRDKENINQWNGPIAITLNGLQIGFNVGVQESEHMIILNDENEVDRFVSYGQFHLELGASIALGTIGRDTNVALSVNEKGYITCTSYSITKGAYIGISMEGQGIVPQNECNDEYFGTTANPHDVFNGKMKPLIVDEEYNLLCRSLNDYIFQQKSEFISNAIKNEHKPGEINNAPTTNANNEKENLTTHNNHDNN